MDDGKKRIAVLSVSSLLLVAMVVGAVINLVGSKNDDHPEISTSTKAIKTICDNVDYQESCIQGLSSKEYNQTDDPKELVKIGFEVSIKHMKDALSKSATLESLEKDPRTKEALGSCGELADASMQDLERSFEKFSNLDIAELNVILADLKVWISGAMTSQQTCLDGFQNTTGDAADKMKTALTLGMQMTTNALAMVTEIATAFAQINEKPKRRLLWEPDWLDSTQRTLLEDAPKKFEANVNVAQDGSGKYKTINEALKDIPKSSNNTFVIHIKEGVYVEKVEILKNMTNVLMIGDGPNKTRITGKLNVIDGTTTYRSATVAVHGDNFIAKDIGFENSAGAEKEQAVALRVSADKTIFHNCWMDGYQDTLYTHTYRQYYRDCAISGTIDFVFGDAAVVFQNCTFLVRKPLDNQNCIVTAQGRKNVRQPTGIVIQNCTFAADSSLESSKSSVKSYLARPWKEFSRTVIMESFIDDLIQPEGYLPWNDTFALNTLFYTEFNNDGPGSSKDKRIKWPGIKELTTDRIKRFTATNFIEGDLWIPRTKVPYSSGLTKPPPKDEDVKASPMSQEEDVEFNHTQSQKQSDLVSVLKSPPSSPPKSSNKPPPPPPPSSSGSGSSSDSGSPSPNSSSGSASSSSSPAPTSKDSPALGPSHSGHDAPAPAPEPDIPFDFGSIFDSPPGTSPPPGYIEPPSSTGEAYYRTVPHSSGQASNNSASSPLSSSGEASNNSASSPPSSLGEASNKSAPNSSGGEASNKSTPDSSGGGEASNKSTPDSSGGEASASPSSSPSSSGQTSKVELTWSSATAFAGSDSSPASNNSAATPSN